MVYRRILSRLLYENANVNYSLGKHLCAHVGLDKFCMKLLLIYIKEDDNEKSLVSIFRIRLVP